jgi:hypothetical protein
MTMNKGYSSTHRNRAIRNFMIGSSFVIGTLAPAFATQHLVAIQEVFVGPPSDTTTPNLGPDQRAQYVMLRMTSSSQTLVSGAAIRVEDAAGNILGMFGAFTATLANGGTLGCVYPSCPAMVLGTTAAKNLFTFTFDKLVDGQAGRVALPVSGGRACWTNGTTTVYDCVAWGNFSCTAANCPGGANAFHAGDLNGNGCDANFDAPAAPGGLQFGKSLTRSTFDCVSKSNSTQFSLQFPRPVNNAGTNNNTDTDGDGLIDQLDCNKTGATIQWTPVEVQNLTVSGHPTSTDSWDSQSAFVGTGVKYDEIRGSLSQVANFTDESCLTPGTTLTSSMDVSLPAAGDGFYYLVRANGGAGCVGTYGKASNGTPRDPQLTACP